MKKLLLFGFEDLPAILALEAAVRPFGAELVPVPRSAYGQSMASLAETGPLPASGKEAPPLGQRMLVLCGLDGELDGLLPALSRAGAGCLKAVLTPHNRGWNAVKLYGELQRERQALRGNGKK